LKAEETGIRALGGVEQDNQFFVVWGSDEESLLQQEEALRDVLDRSQVVDSYRAISKIVPSLRRQAENLDLVRSTLASSELKSQSYIDQDAYLKNQELAMVFADLKDTGMGSLLSPLRFTGEDGQVGQIVTLSGIKSLAKLEGIAIGLDRVSFVDPARDISLVLESYRVKVVIFLTMMSILIFVLLSWRYGLAEGWKIALPSIVAIIATPLILSAFGSVFTFFNAIALVLVFALGIDYALFAAESSEKHFAVSMFANCMSALSSIFAFGLLAFSAQYAIHAFGVTILIGVMIAFLLSPIAGKKKRNSV